jgi:hypothetical protein
MYNERQIYPCLWRGGIAPLILNSVLDGDECSASRSGRFTSRVLELSRLCLEENNFFSLCFSLSKLHSYDS